MESWNLGILECMRHLVILHEMKEERRRGGERRGIEGEEGEEGEEKRRREEEKERRRKTRRVERWRGEK